MSDTGLQEVVLDELVADPKIDPREIAVSVTGGEVTLRGTVGSLRQKREAERAAKRVRGVLEVRNHLEVKLLVGDRHEDSELRGAVLQALALDSQVPSSIDADVNHGIVALTGTVHWQFQRDEAEVVAGNVRGVRGLKSRIVLVPMPSSIDVREAIEQRFKRMATIEADRLTVETTGDTVILSGFVSSWAEHDAALDAAWSLPNVTEVKDRIEITYEDLGLD